MWLYIKFNAAAIAFEIAKTVSLNAWVRQLQSLFWPDF